MDKDFAQAIRAANARSRDGIGTLGEKGIHNTLKHYYEPDVFCHEISIGGYVADIAGESGIIEIQSASFYHLREKLTSFLQYAHVTVVWPCIVSKRLIRIDSDTGEVISTRKSNLHRGEYDVFRELYSIRELIRDPRLSICICQIEADEYRPADLKRGRRRKGAYNGIERYPTALVCEILLNSPLDYLRFIPCGLTEEFTARQFADAAGIKPELSSRVLGVLTALELTKRCGKEGKSYIYRINEL